MGIHFFCKFANKILIFNFAVAFAQHYKKETRYIAFPAKTHANLRQNSSHLFPIYNNLAQCLQLHLLFHFRYIVQKCTYPSVDNQ